MYKIQLCLQNNDSRSVYFFPCEQLQMELIHKLCNSRDGLNVNIKKFTRNELDEAIELLTTE